MIWPDMTWHHITSRDVAWHLATNHITLLHVTSQPSTLLHLTSQPSARHHIPHSITITDTRRKHNQPAPQRHHQTERLKPCVPKNSVWASHWLVALGTYYRQKIFLWFTVFFSLKLPPPARRELLVISHVGCSHLPPTLLFVVVSKAWNWWNWFTAPRPR